MPSLRSSSKGYARRGAFRGAQPPFLIQYGRQENGGVGIRSADLRIGPVGVIVDDTEAHAKGEPPADLAFYVGAEGILGIVRPLQNAPVVLDACR